jgi:outer membrane immunogenic protein
MRILFLTAAAAASVAGLAAAPAAAQVSGARVEAVIGYEGARLDDFGSRDNVSESGMIYGLGIGYDVPLGQTIALGVDLEATDSAVKWRETSTLFSTDLRTALGRDLYAGARITAAVSPGLNLYAKAGYTNVAISTAFTSPTFSEDLSYDQGGLRLGAGAQFAVGANAYVGAEYRYSSYDGDLRRQQGVAALGFRF